MPNADKRLAMLKQLTESGQADAFAWYAFALELKGRREHAEALEAFKKLRERFPDYVPQYLMCGTMLTELGRPGEAREWLENGIIRAQQKGDAHARSELENALEQLPPPPSIA